MFKKIKHLFSMFNKKAHINDIEDKTVELIELFIQLKINHGQAAFNTALAALIQTLQEQQDVEAGTSENKGS
jgi:hypothetical protein